MGCGASSPKRRVMVEAAAAKSSTSKSKAATATAQSGKELDEQNRSAIKVQAHFRGKQTRRLADQRRDQFAMERELKMSSTAKLKRTASNRLERVNDYAFVKMLGKGAYGQVYLAEYDPAPEGTWAETTAETLSSFMGLSEKPPQVAIKCLSRSILKRKRVGRNGSAYDSVLGEIAVMKHLRHPNIVRLFEVIDDPDQDLLFMCMEFVTGGDLFVSITQKRVVPEPELRGWVRGLVLGLEHLHLSGVCHRDIKPENFLWEPSTKQAKLADFGISGFFRATSLGGDFFDATSGSLMFFAPEMCRSLKGAGYSGRAADLWAMGVSIFMWIYWVTPYTASNPPDLLKSIAEDPVVFPPKTPTPSTELLALVRGLLEKSPQQRSQIRHLRRDAFLTRGGADPLDTALPAHNAKDGNVAVSKSELRSAIQRIRALNKSSLSCGTDEEVDYSLDYELVARNSTVSKGALDDAEQERMASMVLTKEETKEKSFERTTVESREPLATGEVAKGEAAAGPTPLEDGVNTVKVSA